MLRLIILIVAVFMFFGAAPAYAQPDLSQMKAELLSGWLVTIDGEDQTRTLRILGMEQKDGGKFSLDAVYGMTDGRQTAVKAEINQTDRQRTLLLTTQPGSKIAANQGPDGNFNGTITFTNGSVKGLTLEKLSDAELLQAVAKIKAGPAIEMPASNVPASCAPFIGGWTGKWGGLGQRYLWVVGIDAGCKAKYAYGSKMASNFKVIEVSKGVFSFPCGTTGGLCHFEHHGDELWGRYSGPDGTNTSVYKKVQ